MDINVLSVENDDANYEKGLRITLQKSTGETFMVNVPDFAWGTGDIYGLNLVFDHSGKGDHYA